MVAGHISGFGIRGIFTHTYPPYSQPPSVYCFDVRFFRRYNDLNTHTFSKLFILLNCACLYDYIQYIYIVSAERMNKSETSSFTPTKCSKYIIRALYDIVIDGLPSLHVDVLLSFWISILFISQWNALWFISVQKVNLCFSISPKWVFDQSKSFEKLRVQESDV